MLDHVLKAIAIVVVVSGVAGVFLTLSLSTPGLMAAFVVVLASVAAVGAGATLVAIDLLFPQAVEFSGVVGLLWLAVPASLVSVTLFNMLLEGGLLALLKRTGLDLPHLWLIETFLEGLFLGLALLATGTFLPDARLSPPAALAAGLISAFIRYYLGMCLDGWGTDDEAELLDDGAD